MMSRGSYSAMDVASLIVQGAMCGVDVRSRLGLLEAASRSRIEMRTHRSGESQAEAKAFFLDLMLEARRSGESARLSSLTAFRSSEFDQIYKYELDSVDASVLDSFMDLLSKKKRDEFMTLAKPESS